MRAALAFCIALFASAPSWAERVQVEVEDQADLGRIIIPLPATSRTTVRQHRTQFDVKLPGGEDVDTPDSVPRNVTSIVGGHGTMRLTIVPGARFSSWHEGRKLIIKVFDPATRGRDAALSASSRPNPAKPAVAVPETPQATTKPVAAEPLPAPAVAPVAPAVAEPEHPAAESPAAAPEPPPRPILRSFTVNASTETGVATFRRAGKGVVIFDEAVTMADADDGEPILVPSVQTIQRGTLITVPLGETEALATTRAEGSVTVTIGAPTGSPAVTAAVPAGIQFQVARPGRVMAVSDPVSGQTMLIGTTRQVNGDRAMVQTGRSAPGYILLPTWLGVALETSSDRVDLKVAASSFTLSIVDKATPNATASARRENQFGIPTAVPEILMRQLNGQIASAAAAPPRGRGPDRVAAARTMLALGMSAEAAALLTLAATDDPIVARDPDVQALAGIAAILAGRPADATGLDNPVLSTNDDLALWRGLRDVDEGKTAPTLANAWPTLAAYPDAIRRQITRPVMEAAAAAGADVPASEMEGPSLALARALKLAHDGETDAALTALAAVKESRDERDSVRAAISLAELSLSTGRGTAADTAGQLERQTIRWRGGVQELSLRLRAAELRSQAGQWRTALDGLRDAQALFPEKKVKITEAKTSVFRSLLSSAAPTIAPLEMVLIAGEYADGLPDGEDGDRLAGLLADKLAALDLPTRAIPVLKSLMEKTQSPIATAEYGLRLAQMEIDAGEAVRAEALLNSLDLNGMPAARQGQRTMLMSKAKAAQGDFAGAAAALLTLSTPEADDMRANFYARAGDWQRSLDTMDGMIAAAVPETGELNERQQELVLRNATAAVQAGNGEALKRIGRFERRMTPPRADLFRILTASAIKGPEDLPRAARELAMSKAIPERLNALKTR